MQLRFKALLRDFRQFEMQFQFVSLLQTKYYSHDLLQENSHHSVVGVNEPKQLISRLKGDQSNFSKDFIEYWDRIWPSKWFQTMASL